MKKGNPELQRLLWMIDFINLNIDQLPRGHYFKLLIEMGENIRPKIDNPGLWTGEIKKLLQQSRQANINRPDFYDPFAFPSLYEKLKDVFDYPTLKIFAKKTQGRIKDVLDRIYGAKDYGEGIESNAPCLEGTLEL